MDGFEGGKVFDRVAAFAEHLRQAGKKIAVNAPLFVNHLKAWVVEVGQLRVVGNGRRRHRRCVGLFALFVRHEPLPESDVFRALELRAPVGAISTTCERGSETVFGTLTGHTTPLDSALRSKFYLEFKGETLGAVRSLGTTSTLFPSRP